MNAPLNGFPLIFIGIVNRLLSRVFLTDWTRGTGKPCSFHILHCPAAHVPVATPLRNRK